jgi:hypothetical protein
MNHQNKQLLIVIKHTKVVKVNNQLMDEKKKEREKVSETI